MDTAKAIGEDLDREASPDHALPLSPARRA
jgi:hypothetical protein